MSEIEPETKRILCIRCNEITHHHLRARHSRVIQSVEDDAHEQWALGYGPRPDELAFFSGSHYDEAKNTSWQVKTSIWSCAGCDEETFEWQYLTENLPGEWSEDDREYYPERSNKPSRRTKRDPKHFRTVSLKLRTLYVEIIGCFNNSSMLLCTIGLRSLLEGICKDKGLTEGNLEHKIDNLIKFLPSVNVIEALHSFRFAGNAAVHDLDPLSCEKADEAIAIVEDLLNFLYDTDYKASQVRTGSNKQIPKSGLVH